MAELICEVCSKAISLAPSTIARGRKHCSKACYTSTMIGKPSLPKGYKHTEETLAKLRISQRKRMSKEGFIHPMKGRKFSVKHRKKLSEAHKLLVGAKSPSWKGGLTSEDRLQRVKFRNSMQSLVFARDNYTCQICDQYSGYLQVDHIKGWAKYPELRFNLDNCRTLCMACHYYITFKKRLPEGVIWGHNLSRRIGK